MIFETPPQTWQELQDFVGQLFIECGFEVEVSKKVDTVRGQKEIDVFVKDLSTEYKPTILIECKFYKSKVKQETVHAFRTVMNDFGANLGYIVAPGGFQKGCYNAIENSNIRLVTFDEMQVEYLAKWKRGMVKKYMPLADRLFPYWDYLGKTPADGKPIDFYQHRLLNSAYGPFVFLSPTDMGERGFIREYPMNLPVLDNELQVVGAETISSDRQYFDFMERNKERVFKHYRILYREEE